MLSLHYLVLVMIFLIQVMIKKKLFFFVAHACRLAKRISVLFFMHSNGNVDINILYKIMPNYLPYAVVRKGS